MSRVFITGSSDGLGQLAARALVKDGHSVVLHARNEARGKSAAEAVPGYEDILIGDLSSIAETIKLAGEVNRLGTFDAIIHNAGVGDRDSHRNATVDGLPTVFAVNSLAPYTLTCLTAKPKRLIYISSGLHSSGDPSLKDLTWSNRTWNGFAAYSDSKLHDVILAFAVARLWPGILSNSVDPGWVATKMGGPSAPDSLEEGYKTQVWLAVSNDPKALVTARHFYHQKLKASHPAASDIATQEHFLRECERLSGIRFPQ